MECRWLHAVDGPLSSGAAGHAGKQRAAPSAQEAVVPEAARQPLEGGAGAGAAWQETYAATGGGQRPEGGPKGPLVWAVQQYNARKTALAEEADFLKRVTLRPIWSLEYLEGV